jgi:hypothetical protein
MIRPLDHCGFFTRGSGIARETKSLASTAALRSRARDAFPESLFEPRCEVLRRSRPAPMPLDKARRAPTNVP